MSMSPRPGSEGSPGAPMPIRGHGLGLRWQKAANSSANSLGRMHRLPWTQSGATPAVWPVYSPARMMRRASLGLWIPVNSHQRAAGIRDSRERALAYLSHHVGNRLDRARAEAYVDSGPAMLDLFERERFVSYTLAPTWADYHPGEPGALQGGRSLVPDEYDGRELGPWFARLRPPIKTMMAFGGMMVGRNDLPHVFQMTQHPQSALH